VALEPSPPSDHLARLASRALDSPFFLAYALARYAARESLSDLGLARRLGYTVETLTNLRLCRMPKDRADVERIAERFGIQPVRLADLLRVGH
jgi:hypothetical protein